MPNIPKSRRGKKVTHSELRFFDDWMTIYDLMDRLDQNYEWVYDNVVKPGLIPYRKIGSLYLWHKARIDQWLLNGDDRPNGTP